jgi:DNA-binding PadR family transcriptional regulator
MPPSSDEDLLLGEWACLGALAEEPSHGFALAKRLAPDGDLGRIWSLSRPLTYRSIDRLVTDGLVAAVRTEPGRAGGERTVMGSTPTGRRHLKAWLRRPVAHVRDLRSELLLKLELCDRLGIDPSGLLAAQRELVADVVRGLRASSDRDDAVRRWRIESATAAIRFLDWRARMVNDQ